VEADFVWRMEAVLDLYGEAYDPRYPMVCFDELPVALQAEVVPVQGCAPGRVRRFDYEYEHRGSCTIFMTFEPLRGWRRSTVSDHRTKVDFAHQMRQLVDEDFPDAAKIRVVLDNLNTHTFAALYTAFPPEEARRIARKLEFHYTPKHGSWLNMVEIEFAVLTKQCLRRRLPETLTLQTELRAWDAQRNAAHATIQWLFDVTTARTKLSRLYPSSLLW
jgi:hypothetical protein